MTAGQSDRRLVSLTDAWSGREEEGTSDSLLPSPLPTLSCCFFLYFPSCVERAMGSGPW